MGIESIIVWLIVGAIAGWLAAAGRDADAHRALAASAALRGGVDRFDPVRLWVLAHMTAAAEETPATDVDANELIALLD